jgi:hypothetical protein
LILKITDFFAGGFFLCGEIVAKQLVLLAMHHSGTSLLARLVMEMGAFGGERDEFKLQGGKKVCFVSLIDLLLIMIFNYNFNIIYSIYNV